MLRKPTYTGIDSILDGFDSLNPEGKYVCSLWHSDNDIAFQCLETDFDLQRESLEKQLVSLNKAGNSELMYLKFHPPVTEGFITKKTPVISVTPIRITELQEAQVISGSSTIKPAGLSYETWEMLKTLKDLPSAIDAKIDARLAELLPEVDEEEPEPEDATMKAIGVIKGLMSDPDVKSIIGAILSYLKPQPVSIGRAEQLNNPLPVMQEQTMAAQHIEFNEDLMNESLNRLRFHCDLGEDLRRLADLAENQPEFFKQMLSTLRS